MKKNTVRDYWEYDYIDLAVKTEKADDLLSGYGAFLWQEIERKADKNYKDVVHITLKRPHKIKNKDRLQLLQVRYEKMANDKYALKKKKHTRSHALIANVGAFGALAFLGAVAAAFYLKTTASIICACIWTALEVAFSIFLAVKYRKMRKKENEIYEKKDADINADISNLFKEVGCLTGGDNG